MPKYNCKRETYLCPSKLVVHWVIMILFTTRKYTHTQTHTHILIHIDTRLLSFWTLQWRRSDQHGVSDHRHLDCLCSRLFRRTSKLISKLRVTGLCEGNPPVTGGFPSKRASARKIFPFDDVIMKSSQVSIMSHSLITRCFSLASLTTIK